MGREMAARDSGPCLLQGARSRKAGETAKRDQKETKPEWFGFAPVNAVIV
jgi:hypothetical protein